MIVVGFDTATAATSVCVIGGDGRAFEGPRPGPGWMDRPPAHASEVLPRLAQLLDSAGAGFADIGEVAVGVGPGTFTGLRIGVATARALGQALSVPVKPVSTLATLAAGLAEVAESDQQLLPVIDAKRKQVFAALFELRPQGPVAVWQELVATPAQLAARVRAASKDSSPGILAAGDGAVRFRTELEATGVVVAPDGSPAHAPRALHTCNLARGAGPVTLEEIEPTYLRLPDAEISLRRQPAGMREQT